MDFKDCAKIRIFWKYFFLCWLWDQLMITCCGVRLQVKQIRATFIAEANIFRHIAVDVKEEPDDGFFLSFLTTQQRKNVEQVMNPKKRLTALTWNIGKINTRRARRFVCLLEGVHKRRKIITETIPRIHSSRGHICAENSLYTCECSSTESRGRRGDVRWKAAYTDDSCCCFTLLFLPIEGQRPCFYLFIFFFLLSVDALLLLCRFFFRYVHKPVHKTAPCV